MIFKVIIVASVGPAIYALLVYLVNFKEAIGHYKPFWKFFSIKIILFLSVWQKIVLQLLRVDKILVLEEKAVDRYIGSSSYIDETLISVEMFILSLLAIKNFSYKDFKKGHSMKLGLSTISAIPKIL